MATTDSELITEVRGLTDYHADVMSDGTIQTLIDIGKEELRARFGVPGFTFYEEGTHSADRALFWFTCIATKIRAGEIAGMNVSVDEIASSSPSGTGFDFWFQNFQSRLNEADRSLETTAAVSITSLTRDNRSYGDQA